MDVVLQTSIKVISNLHSNSKKKEISKKTKRKDMDVNDEYKWRFFHTRIIDVGWPKFVAQLWLKNEQRNQLIAASYGPCAVSTTLQNVSITLQEITNYPFEDNINVYFSVDRPAKFALCVGCHPFNNYLRFFCHLKKHNQSIE
jgi:hypothetical protein